MVLRGQSPTLCFASARTEKWVSGCLGPEYPSRPAGHRTWISLGPCPVYCVTSHRTWNAKARTRAVFHWGQLVSMIGGIPGVAVSLESRQQHLPCRCTVYFSPFGSCGGHLEIALILPVSYRRFLFPAAPNPSVLSSGLMSCRQTRTLIHSAAGPEKTIAFCLPEWKTPQGDQRSWVTTLCSIKWWCICF